VGRGGVNGNRQSSEIMDWRTNMHWESNSVDPIFEVDKRRGSELALRLRRRKGEGGTVISDSSPRPKSATDVLQGCRHYT